MQIWVRIPIVYPHVMLEENKVEETVDMLTSAGFGPGTRMDCGVGAAEGGGAAEAAARTEPIDTVPAARAGGSDMPKVVTTCGAPAALKSALQPRQRDDPWEAWNTLRSLCEHNPNVGVCLELTANLPSNTVLQKWYGEPVRVRSAASWGRYGR